MKRTTNANTFKYALAVFSQELSRRGLNPTNDQIVRLSIAVDESVQFSIDRSETVMFLFSDGSRATIHPQTTH